MPPPHSACRRCPAHCFRLVPTPSHAPSSVFSMLLSTPRLTCRPDRHCICWAAAEAGTGGAGGNASRRRSQRLRQPRDNSSARDLERQLREKDARLEEQQRRLQQLEQQGDEPQEQQQQQQGGQQEEQRQEDAEQRRLQEEAARSLLAGLAQKQTEAEAGPDGKEPSNAASAARPAGEAEAEAEAQVEAAVVQGPETGFYGSAGAGGPAAPAADGTVEADFVIEQQGAQALGAQRREELRSEISRQSEALLAIIQAGERVEEVIAELRADIDVTMLKLLARRIKAAKQLEKRPEVIKGLQLLFRRLKAEVDRQRASPSLRLLDELMSILDAGDAETLARASTQEERRRQAAARVRAAFSGGVGGEADVLSLAAQLGGGGGEELADQLVADPVDPTVFMAETTQLLGRVEQQQRQLEAWLEQQRRQEEEEEEGRKAAVQQSGVEQQGEHERGAALAEGEDGEEERRQQERERRRLEVEGVLEQRRAAASLVQQSLDVAQAVMQQMQVGL